MAFRKKVEGKKIASARQRFAGLQNIDAKRGKTINYGLEDHPLTQQEFKNELDAYTEAIKSYNQILMQADAQSNLIKEMERKIGKISAAVLKAASAKFGDDANEIEMLGGTRTSDRKAPLRKKN